ncbi:unnamed protein product [Trichogramma brassicae]|uniref:Uncharacterized protein n=1 Tax=Trichogramma brassicae TaxID=86971 RepID=A0A6H5IVU5_9HYME|nr:unnamed protein product [Trichogramma brassicae]
MLKTTSAHATRSSLDTFAAASTGGLLTRQNRHSSARYLHLPSTNSVSSSSSSSRVGATNEQLVDTIPCSSSSNTCLSSLLRPPLKQIERKEAPSYKHTNTEIERETIESGRVKGLHTHTMPDNKSDVSLNNQKPIEGLKNLRENVNWEIEKERYSLLEQLYFLFKNWKGQFPNLQEIFRSGEIECLITDSMNDGYGHLFAESVARIGYKDEPKVDNDGRSSPRRTTPIHRASKYKLYHLLNILFKIYNRFDVNYTDESGYTHFRVACQFGSYDVVEKFLELGQDPNCIWPKTNDSPLHLALEFGNTEIAELLLRRGAIRI